ncbi:SDR family NAD(P)-dependent oxidoreductase [Pontibacter oryzae]|uniref:SDR family oxidoreductase n=1 Tax=Pontibacter oryzae TaxID=2304593 RepID=A0A399SFM0_9BACT|nr:SDR family oxidoreductase [Pontibacter oryzae]RIJ42008.1 SDR family oxidoreductase [Pontibacter oryzae]
MPLKDKNILVVGGTSGIGLQTARRLQEKGANVIVASRKPSEESEALNLQHVPLDVLQFDAQPLLEALPNVLHGTVYCPGSIKLKPFERMKIEDFRNDLELNVLGAVQVLQAVMPLLKKAEGSSVVLFSTVAVGTGMPFHTSIATAKAAVQGLAVSLAAEYASAKVRVNTIAPSLTDTPLAKSLLSSPEKAEAAGKRHPLGRVGKPDDMASAALYLLSDDSAWMTGQTLRLDGGMSSIKLI